MHRLRIAAILAREQEGAAVPMLSVRQVAETFDTNEQHVRALARRGTIPAVKVGKLWRFRPEDVEAVLKPAPAKKR